MITLSKEFDIDINTLFFNTIDFSQRKKWQVGIKDADQVSDTLPQVGTSHRCVLDKGEMIQYTSSYSLFTRKDHI